LPRSLLFGTFVLACCAAGQQQPVFRAQTRLVEVDVVIRDKYGPVTGLTKDDFTLYDCKSAQRDLDHAGSNVPCKFKKQEIAVFHEVNTGPGGGPAVSPLPAGAVSNRLDSSGKPVGAATVVVIDQLNTPFDLKGHERLELTKFLESVGDHERIAVYSLGKDLHLLQDFTGDAKKLVDAVSRIDSGDYLSFGGGTGDANIDGIEDIVIRCIKKGTTDNAVEAIIHHMNGVPGRKNLLWLAQGFFAFGPAPTVCGPPKAGPMLGQASIATYPVLVRSVLDTGMTTAESRRMAPPGRMMVLDMQHNIRLRGASLGGAGFNDASQLPDAFRAAQNDSSNYYVLGFYPAESDLGEGTHQLTVEVRHSVSRRTGFSMRHRQTYRAAKPGTKEEAEENEKPLSLLDIFRSPLDANAIGLTAVIKPDPVRPGARLIAMTVDLTDLQLQPEGDRWTGSLQVAMRLESKEGENLVVTQPVTDTVHFNLTNAEFEAGRSSGLQLALPLPANTPPGSVHIVVQGIGNGAAGSLRVPMPAKP
jgi:VWFA-related protein